jgi:hypothetical protein
MKAAACWMRAHLVANPSRRTSSGTARSAATTSGAGPTLRKTLWRSEIPLSAIPRMRWSAPDVVHPLILGQLPRAHQSIARTTEPEVPTKALKRDSGRSSPFASVAARLGRAREAGAERRAISQPGLSSARQRRPGDTRSAINLEPRVPAVAPAAPSHATPAASGTASTPGPAGPCEASGTARGEGCR